MSRLRRVGLTDQTIEQAYAALRRFWRSPGDKTARLRLVHSPLLEQLVKVEPDVKVRTSLTGRYLILTGTPEKLAGVFKMYLSLATAHFPRRTP